MFFRLKKSGPRSYLQIVENRRDGRAVRQHVIATIGRIDELAARGGLATLRASGARFCEQVMLLSALDDPEQAARLSCKRIKLGVASEDTPRATGCFTRGGKAGAPGATTKAPPLLWQVTPEKITF